MLHAPVDLAVKCPLRKPNKSAVKPAASSQLMADCHTKNTGLQSVTYNDLCFEMCDHQVSLNCIVYLAVSTRVVTPGSAELV